LRKEIAENYFFKNLLFLFIAAAVNEIALLIQNTNHLFLDADFHRPGQEFYTFKNI